MSRKLENVSPSADIYLREWTQEGRVSAIVSLSTWSFLFKASTTAKTIIHSPNGGPKPYEPYEPSLAHDMQAIIIPGERNRLTVVGHKIQKTNTVGPSADIYPREWTQEGRVSAIVSLSTRSFLFKALRQREQINTHRMEALSHMSHMSHRLITTCKRLLYLASVVDLRWFEK